MTAPVESLTNPDSWALSDCAKAPIDAHKGANRASMMDVRPREEQLMPEFRIRASCCLCLSVLIVKRFWSKYLEVMNGTSQSRAPNHSINDRGFGSSQYRIPKT